MYSINELLYILCFKSFLNARKIQNPSQKHNMHAPLYAILHGNCTVSSIINLEFSNTVKFFLG